MVQQMFTEVQKEIGQKPERTVGVNEINFFDNKDKDKDAANCLTSLKISVSPQTPRNIDDNIGDVKTPSKGFISLHDPKNHPNRSVVNHKPTKKVKSFAGKEESSYNKQK